MTPYSGVLEIPLNYDHTAIFSLCCLEVFNSGSLSCQKKMPSSAGIWLILIKQPLISKNPLVSSKI